MCSKVSRCQAVGGQMPDHSNSPDLSVVIVTPDNYQVIRKTIRHLRAQTVTDRLEIEIGAPSEKGLHLIESDLAGFHSYKNVEAGEVRVLPHTKTAAITRTTAPVEAFADAHCCT